MLSIQSSVWSDIEALRSTLHGQKCASLEEAAQGFAVSLATSCATVILARVFVVLPLSRLSEPDRRYATELVAGHSSLENRTPVLCLFGTYGREAAWRDRNRSDGHRAIPLLGSAFVQSIPMIAKLLADLNVSLLDLDDRRVLDTRPLLGGMNGAFFVNDARVAEDARCRRVIPSKEFVDAYGVRTVFGMGGAYFDGTLAVAIVFTSEVIDRLVADRFPSLISNFKMATSALLMQGSLYRETGT
jgi:hypothetical protein